MTGRRYSDPPALRQALTDRLRQLTRERPGAQLADLQRLFACDRLLARLHGSARHTVDVDLYRRAGHLDAAETALRAAAAADLGDFFRFTRAPGQRVAEGRATFRIAATTYLGATEFARFHIDLITGIQMTGEPDEVEPLEPIQLPGIAMPHYHAYPLVDHVADKVCALLERHPRSTGTTQGSTRYRDLADLALIAHTQSVAADELRRALDSEARRRGLRLPASLPSPEASGGEPDTLGLPATCPDCRSATSMPRWRPSAASSIPFSATRPPEVGNPIAWHGRSDGGLHRSCGSRSGIPPTRQAMPRGGPRAATASRPSFARCAGSSEITPRPSRQPLGSGTASLSPRREEGLQGGSSSSTASGST